MNKGDFLKDHVKHVDITSLLFCDSIAELIINPEIPCFVSPLGLFTRTPTGLIKNWNSLGLVKNFDSIVDSIGWAKTLRKIKKILRGIHQKYWFAVQRGLLVGLGMREIAAYDGNPMNLLAGVRASDTLDDAKRKIYGKSNPGAHGESNLLCEVFYIIFIFQQLEGEPIHYPI